MNASAAKPLGTSVNNQNPYLPTDSRASRQPDNRQLSSKLKGEQSSLYLSRFNGEIPEDRLRKSKAQSTKLIDSNLRRLSLRQEVVNVHEEKPILNSTAAGQVVPGFEDEEFQNKKFKKFTISSAIKERELIKESNYFDQTHDPTENINPVADKHSVDFRIGDLKSFETFQVKTYLYDRNLTHKIAS